MGGFDAWADAADRALALAAKAGLDAQVRAERFVERTLVVAGDTLTAANSLEGAGVGVRVLHRGRSGYASTTTATTSELRRIVGEAAAMAGAPGGAARRVPPAPPATSALPADLVVEDPELAAKLDLLRRATRTGRDAGKDVAAATSSYTERLGDRLVLRTDGARARWSPRAVTLDAIVLSKAPHGLARGRDFHGGSLHLSDFVGPHAPEELGRRAAEWAAERIGARRPSAGRHRTLIDPLLAGILAHESFGHLTEGDLTEAGWSLLKDRVGQRLGSRHVTIRDTGRPPEGVGGLDLPYDDEATPSREVTVLDRGVLRRFLHGRATAGDGTTGNARALDYRFPPVVRMRNTYVEPGDLRLEEALEGLGNGIYACGSTGGEARSDGHFMFTVTRAYRVERGEVVEALRPGAILGDVLQFLRSVEGATRDLRLFGGALVNCGKWGQWPLPVAHGGPHLLLRQATFAGEGTWRAA